SIMTVDSQGGPTLSSFLNHTSIPTSRSGRPNNLSVKSQPPTVLPYQIPFVERVTRVIRANFLSRVPRLRILDAGCDPSGRQLWHLARLTRGEVIGVNIGEGFPSPEALAGLPVNARLLNM